MFRSNPFECNVIFVYEIRSYVDISLNTCRLLPIKQIDGKYFCKKLNVNIPILVQRVLSSVPKFYMFLVKYIDQVSDFHMNHQKKTNLDFCDTAKNLYFNYKNKTVLQIIETK